MDNVTHAVFGMALAEAGFRERLGWKVLLAAPVLAWLSDADVLAARNGPWEILASHRGPTHSLLVLAAAAPLAGLALWWMTRRRDSWGLWSLFALLMLASNPVLDWLTSYGTQLLWPVTKARFAADALAIIDPWYTGPLVLATLVLPLTLMPRARTFSRRFALAALIVSTLYVAFCAGQMLYVRSVASRQLAREDFRAARLRACPTIMTNMLWRVVARDGAGDIRVGYYSTLAPREIRFAALDRPDSPLVARALETERGRLFAWFADGYVSARVERRATETVVLLDDQRYGLVTEPGRSFFRAEAVFDAEGNFLRVDRLFGARFDRRREIAAAWDLMLGREPRTENREQP